MLLATWIPNIKAVLIYLTVCKIYLLTYYAINFNLKKKGGGGGKWQRNRGLYFRTNPGIQLGSYEIILNTSKFNWRSKKRTAAKLQIEKQPRQEVRRSESEVIHQKLNPGGGIPPKPANRKWQSSKVQNQNF